MVQSEWDYTVDTLSRAWLPAGQPEGNSGNVGRSDSKMAGGYIVDYGQSPPEMVSLADLKLQITEMETRIAAGAGVPGFRDCMHYKIIGDRHLRAEPWTPPEVAVEIPSGSAAGTELYRKNDTDGEPEYNRYWLSGPDAGMFQALRVDDDTDPTNGYEHMLATARPLPGREYVVLYNLQLYVYFPCNFVPDDTYIEWAVTVEHLRLARCMRLSSTRWPTERCGGVHHRLRPPGACILRPAGGTAVEITDLRWEEGSVSLTVNPAGGLTDFTLEFIEQDGTTSRNLSGSAATQDLATGTITWQVSSQTWEDGDLLLLRIRDGGGDPSGTPAPMP